ncbi:hypothetical protein ACWIT3_08405 [Pasteurella sp. P03HT]
MRKVYRLEIFNTDDQLEYIADYPTFEQAEQAKLAIASELNVLRVNIIETTSPNTEIAKEARMRKVIWQVIAYTENGKPSIMGSDASKDKAWEIARSVLDEQADLYIAVTVKRVLVGGEQ